MQRVSTSGVNVSWFFIAEHSEVETAGVVEWEREGEGQGSTLKLKQQHDKVALLVSRSGFHSYRQNSRNWISSTTRWTGDSQESLGQVDPIHGPRNQVIPGGGERDMRIRGSISKITQHTR